MRVERRRVGLFFLFIGMISLVIFFTADHSTDPGVEYFFFGLLFVVMGGTLIWRDRKPPQESKRFRILRRKKSKAERESSKEQ
jgi:hypothetical protein